MERVVRHDDGELCGFVRAASGRWQALAVFGGVLASFDVRDDAISHVERHGLPSLQRRWRYRASPADEWQTVLVQEAAPGRVRLALGHYSLPGVPVIELDGAALDGTAALELPPEG